MPRPPYPSPVPARRRSLEFLLAFGMALFLIGGFSTATEVRPDRIGAHLYRTGLQAFSGGDFETAAESFEEVASRSLLSATAFIRAGCARWQLGQGDQAALNLALGRINGYDWKRLPVCLGSVTPIFLFDFKRILSTPHLYERIDATDRSAVRRLGRVDEALAESQPEVALGWLACHNWTEGLRSLALTQIQYARQQAEDPLPDEVMRCFE